jgi:hypothetical protein
MSRVKLPKHPNTYLKEYLGQVYDSEISKEQSVEVSCAFHAGIEAMCKFVEDYMVDDNVDDDDLVQRMINFRRRNKDCAMHHNLLRSSE